MLLLATLCFWSQPVHATGAANPNTVLVLNSTVTGGAGSLEATKAGLLGLTVEFVDDAGWAAKSTADFATYKGIILGDPRCFGPGTGPIAAALANRGTWTPAITGNVIVFGTDVSFHSSDTQGGILAQNGIAFATAEAGKTGAYITLSCYYTSGTPPNTPVPLLDAFGGGGFTVENAPGCFNDAHIVATHPALAGLTDANLSNWSCSVHEIFDAWPADFKVLGIARTGSVFTAPDGTVGTPYIMARGESLVSLGLSLTPASATNPVGTAHTVTAELHDPEGTPIAGSLLGFKITGGPNTGTTGTCVPADCRTDGSGRVTFTYTGIGGLGDDSIQAFVDANANGAPDVGEAAATARKTWGGPATPLPTPGPGCTRYSATDLPKDIPDNGEVTSTVTVPAGMAISDLNILGLQGDHGFFQDLEIHLINPAMDTDVIIVDRVCGNASGPFNFGLDDSSLLDIQCPPVGGTAYFPSHVLSAFNGQDPGGRWTLRVVDKATSDAGHLSGWTLEVCGGGTPTPTTTPEPGCTRYTSTDVPKDIPDNGEASSTLVVPAGVPISDLNVIDLQGDHAFLQDLEIHLINPAMNTDVIVVDRVCGESTGPFNFGLDDSSLLDIECPPVSGARYFPSHLLAAFNGQSQGGTWTLRIIDKAPLDSGHLSGWGLEFCTGGTPSPTPTPTVHGCTSYFSTDVPKDIPDDGEVSSTLTVPASLPISYLNVRNLRGDHTFLQDLEIHLINPAMNTDVVIVDRVCGLTSGPFDISLSDSSLLDIECPPVADTLYFPSHLLAAFNGQDPAGTWTLRVVDKALLDMGRLTGWGLEICVGGTPTPTATGHAPSPTPTLTRTHRPSPTETEEPSHTPTRTRTFTPTLTPPPSLTPTGTLPPTPTVTRTGTFTPTTSRTPTRTPTATREPKPTFTPTPTASETPTEPATPTFTQTENPTVTPTGPRPETFTPTPTFTVTATFTSTPTGTRPATPTFTVTATFTSTPTGTRPATPTVSLTPTVRVSVTPTQTRFPTTSPTRTREPKFTFTPTATGSMTPTGSVTPTGSRPATTTPTQTPTGSRPVTATATPTATGPTATVTPTGSRPATTTPTPTATGPTATRTPSGSPTATGPTATVTPTGSRPATPTPTATATGPTATATPTGSRPPEGSPTPTGSPGPCGCVGDCNCDGEVTVDELLIMVNIALETTDVSRCLAGDANGDRAVTIDEILIGVNNALANCPLLTATATPTITPTRVGPVPTDTATATPTPPAGDGTTTKRAAGSAVGLTQALRAIPAMLSAVTQLAGGGGGSAGRGGGGAVQACSGGGTRNLVCTQAVPGVSPRNYELTFSACVLNSAGGGSVMLNGMLTGQSTETGLLAICSLPPTSLSTIALNNVQVAVKNGAGTTTLSAVFNLTGSLSVTPDFLSSCKIAAFDATFNGTASVQLGASTVTMQFNSTHVRLDIDQFSASCVPVIYRMTLNGEASFTSDSLGGTFTGTFTNFTLRDDTTSGDDLVSLSGRVNSTCLGAEVTFTTVTQIRLTAAAVCPVAGSLRITTGATDRIGYTATGGVEIDLGDNGGVDQAFTTCLDPALRVCPAM